MEQRFDQKREFAERIARIEHASTRAHGRSGGRARLSRAQKAEIVYEPGFRPPVAEKPPLTSSLTKLVLAFVVGFGSMLLGRVMAFRYTGVEVDVDDILGSLVLFGGDIGVAIGASLIAMLFLGLNRTPFIQAEIAGFLVILYAEGMIAQQVPEIWSSLFSPEYTAMIVEEAPTLDFGFEAVASSIAAL